MGGGLIQIASYGLQDIFLIGNPQITFLKQFIENIQIFLWNINKNILMVSKILVTI